MFSGYQQHDAQEFLRFLLTHIEECQTVASQGVTGQVEEMDCSEEAIDESTGLLASNVDEEVVRVTPAADSGISICTEPEPPLRKRKIGSEALPPSKRTHTLAETSEWSPSNGPTAAAADGTDATPEPGIILASSITQPVTQLFQGKLVYATRCLECEVSSTRTESFLDLSLSVEETDYGRSLGACLDAFTSPQDILSGTNKYRCDSCRTYSEATRSIRIAWLPPILTFHLNRSSADGYRKVRAPR